MFQLYLLLRLKNFGRIVIELGIFRIVFLTILTVAAIMILFLAENRFAIPVVCVLLLAMTKLRLPGVILANTSSKLQFSP